MQTRSAFRFRTIGVGALLLLLAGSLAGASSPARKPISWREPVKEKNFYLLALLEGSPEAAAALRGEGKLSGLARSFAQRAAEAPACGPEPACVVGKFLWSETEIEAAAGALRALYGSSADVRNLVEGELRASGMYVRSHGLPGPELLATAWKADIAGVNRMMEIYGLGKPPRYPAIDSIALDTTKDTYKRLLQITATTMLEQVSTSDVFFSASLRLALALAEASNRDEAGRFEPMHFGENRAAWQRIAATDWSRYPYTAIVVPGAGGDRPGIALSPWGRLRVRIAAKRYFDGKAPFLIVSGGFVHPNQTPFCEALEMKRALMRDHGVPESAILIDPHARHTTTNIRNANRLLYRYGFPFAAKALITTDPFQSMYIEAAGFPERCRRELGYVPFDGLKRLNSLDLEYLPTLESLQADAVEPLDP